MRYPWHLVPRLVRHIEMHEPTVAHAVLERHLDVIAEGTRPLAIRLLRCAALISFCLRGAHLAAAPSDDLLRLHFEALEGLENTKSWPAARKLVHRYVSDLFALLQRDERSAVQRFVEKMRDDMRNSLESPRTLREFAAAGGFSVGHLSRAFTAIAGLPFKQELRRMRIVEACRLLSDTPLKITSSAAEWECAMLRSLSPISGMRSVLRQGSFGKEQQVAILLGPTERHQAPCMAVHTRYLTMSLFPKGRTTICLRACRVNRPLPVRWLFAIARVVIGLTKFAGEADNVRGPPDARLLAILSLPLLTLVDS